MSRSTPLYRITTTLFAVLSLLLSLLAPLYLLYKSLSSPWQTIWLPLASTLLIAIVAASFSAMLGLIVSLSIFELTNQRHHPLHIVYMTANLSSSVIAVVVLLIAPGTPSLGRVLLALIMATTPYTVHHFLKDLYTIQQSTLDACRALGAGRKRVLIDIILPYMQRSIAACFLHSMARVFGEIAIFMILLPTPMAFLTQRLASDPLSKASWASALVLCIGCMVMYEIANHIQLGGKR